MGLYVMNRFCFFCIMSLVFICCSATPQTNAVSAGANRYSELSDVLKLKSVTRDGKRHFVRIDKKPLCSSSSILVQIEISDSDEVYPVTTDAFSEYAYFRIKGIDEDKRFLPPSYYYGKEEILHQGDVVEFTVVNEYGEPHSPVKRSGWYKTILRIWPNIAEMEEVLDVYFFSDDDSSRLIDDKYLCKEE